MEYWSWVLAVIGVTGMFFVGKKTLWGWLVLLLNECLWIGYALVTKQYGFIVMAVAYSVVYIRSYIHWKKEAQMSCYCCDNELDYDAGTPFCDPCWHKAMVDKDEETAKCFLRWIAQ